MRLRKPTTTPLARAAVRLWKSSRVSTYAAGTARALRIWPTAITADQAGTAPSSGPERRQAVEAEMVGEGEDGRVGLVAAGHALLVEEELSDERVVEGVAPAGQYEAAHGDEAYEHGQRSEQEER